MRIFLTALPLLFLTSRVLAAEPKVHCNLAYAEPKNERQTLDVYAPTERMAGGPRRPISAERTQTHGQPAPSSRASAPSGAGRAGVVESMFTVTSRAAGGGTGSPARAACRRCNSCRA
jgi:hypothetical protein